MESLKVENVSKIYSQKDVSLQALSHINMTVKKGEFVAILGRSGSGKSTLLNVLSGLDSPTEGEVFIDGENISKLKEEKRTMLRRKKLGLFFRHMNCCLHLQ